MKKIKEVREELKKRMHHSIKETGDWLASVITGHVNYYGVPGNWHSYRDRMPTFDSIGGTYKINVTDLRGKPLYYNYYAYNGWFVKTQLFSSIQFRAW